MNSHVIGMGTFTQHAHEYPLQPPAACIDQSRSMPHSHLQAAKHTSCTLFHLVDPASLILAQRPRSQQVPGCDGHAAMATQGQAAGLFRYQPQQVYPMVPVHAAVAAILAEATQLHRSEDVPVTTAHGRVLAQVGYPRPCRRLNHHPVHPPALLPSFFHENDPSHPPHPTPSCTNRRATHNNQPAEPIHH